MKLVRTLLGLTLAVSAACPAPADAYSCGEWRPTYQRYKTTDVIFVGVVTHIGPDDTVVQPGASPSPTDANGKQRRRPVYATLRVEEVFRGLDRSTRDVRIEVTGATVSVRFNQIGSRYLVFAFHDREKEGVLQTSGCAGTRELDGIDVGDLTYLRGVAEGRRLGAIYGEIRGRDADDGRINKDLAPPEGVRVVAEGESGRFEVGHNYGTFELYVPPGVYRLSIEPGSNVEIRKRSRHEELVTEIEVVADNGTEVEVGASFDYRRPHP